ncbi:hypothetical protein J3B02_002193 [Coemansia erecta]|uniref:Needs CLA4 to survive protein 3 n=1 Tax=Coemansia asiatica TaxID=1052880 RepID=A0A9W7XMR9_9FUNG|nr:hypothetical protein LPJ64_002601 [Coemansia asiatica]KAJ2855394.1 hypothetical protein J3B02_002193 [Coemansia erecta]
MEKQKRIDELRGKLESLRKEELEIQAELLALEADTLDGRHATGNKLSNEAIGRYSRQLLIPEIGMQGQLKLRNSSVLVVGSGGLGSPCALYLASMGIGRLGLVDHDVVDQSNLHRQVLHTEASCGVSKVVSAATALTRLSSMCDVRAHDVLLDSTNAKEIMRGYDVVVDATDNAATRYLVNDACVMLGIPLVSGSAVRLDGQLTVYNYNGGPCYRCLFPTPPAPDATANCSETGVLGVVPGVIGCLQAMEVVKIVTERKREEEPSLLLFSYRSQPHFRKIKLRMRKPTCAVCGDSPTVTGLVDYVAFCGAGPSDNAPEWQLLRDAKQRVSCTEYHQVQRATDEASSGAKGHLLLDVRDEVQFAICQLPNAVNIPIDQFEARKGELERLVQGLDGAPVYAVCRRGNVSQMAVQFIREKLRYEQCFDIAGGLVAWQREVDADFPAY